MCRDLVLTFLGDAIFLVVVAASSFALAKRFFLFSAFLDTMSAKGALSANGEPAPKLSLNPPHAIDNARSTGIDNTTLQNSTSLDHTANLLGRLYIGGLFRYIWCSHWWSTSTSLDNTCQPSW